MRFDCGCEVRQDGSFAAGCSKHVPEAAGKSALEDAADEIARLCGCPEWDYPAQLVRDVQSLLSRCLAAEADRDRYLARAEAAEAGAGHFRFLRRVWQEDHAACGRLTVHGAAEFKALLDAKEAPDGQA